MSYLQNIGVPKETKDINVKAFNVITNKDEAKAMTEHISCDCKCKSNRTKCMKNGIIKYANVNVKVTIIVENIMVGIVAHVFVRIVSI